MNRYYFLLTHLNGEEQEITRHRDSLKDAWMSIVEDYGYCVIKIALLEADGSNVGIKDGECDCE